MNFKAVIFDLDGTLLDTLEDIAETTNKVLSNNGFSTYPLNRYRDFVGSGLRVLISRVLPPDKRDEATIEKCVREFRSDYKKSWNVKTKPYDGIAALLDALSNKGIKLAILSNKPHDFTLQCVGEMLPQWHFEMIQGLHDGIPAKPAPQGALQIADFLQVSPAQILYVGDTDIDMKTATAAGMFSCGALWGFRSREELECNGAKVLIGHPLELLKLLD